jgi:subtilisin family serine protease
MGQALEKRFIVQWEDGHFSVEEAENAKVFSKEFIEPRIADIKYVTYDREFRVDQTSEVRTSTAYTDSWGQEMIGAPQLWAQDIKGQGISIAVVDSFVDVTHPQIAPRILVNTGEIPSNGIDDDNNGVVDDYYGAKFVSKTDSNATPSSHGTHVSGIIAADHTTGSIEGVAPKASLIPAQFIANSGSGSLGDAIKALQYASSRGAKIINASWGGAPCDGALYEAFKQLNNKGILVVVAAGNEGTDIDDYPTFPAAFNVGTQITVAAGNSSDIMTAWSNSGLNLVHIGAPGEGILSTVPNNSTAYMDGTSMAAPFVSGAAALIWSARPQATAQQVKAALLQSVDVVPGHEYRVSTRGRLNVAKALAKLLQLVP